MSEYSLLVINTISAAIGAIAGIAMAIGMIREARKPAENRHYWPWLVAMALVAVIVSAPLLFAFWIIGYDSRSVAQLASTSQQTSATVSEYLDSATTAWSFAANRSSPPLTFWGTPLITVDKLRVFVDHKEYFGGRWTPNITRAEIGDLRDVVKGTYREIALVHEANSGPLKALRWGPPTLNQDIPMPQEITSGSFGVMPAIPIRMRVVIIGPDNKEQYFYTEMLELTDNPNNQRFIIIHDDQRPAWAMAWESH